MNDIIISSLSNKEFINSLPENLGAFKLESDALPCMPGVNGPPPGISFPEPLGGIGPPEGCCEEFALETLKLYDILM